MGRADFSAPKGRKIGVAVVVALLHVLAVLALMRAFAPDLTAQVTREVIAAFDVSAPQPDPPPPRPPTTEREPEGAAAEAGRKAKPKAATAPRARIEITKTAAPKVASTGSDVTSGARDAGAGTGAGGTGSGTGSGNSGSGQGGGMAAKAVKIAGDINSARDYPAKTRGLRMDDHVIVVLTVGTDGRVKACRVSRASRDAEADRITCRLAQERFRFRPATDAAGNPVESVYGWKQWWFDPRRK